MNEIEFRTATIIGTGMMSPGLAAVAALGGLNVTIYGRAVEKAEAARLSALTLIGVVAGNGLAPAVPTGAIESTTAFESAVQSADIVFETIPEELDLKQRLFARCSRIARPDCVLATNTSGLSISEVAKDCLHPERVLTTHFWNPAHLMPLVEIVRGAKTSPEVAEAVHKLLKRCGKLPVIIRKDRRGQLGNRLQMALLREACNIVEEGIASVEDVDLAARAGFGLRLPVYGIFEHQDVVGLDLGFNVIDYVVPDLSNYPRGPANYKQHVIDGNLGVKTGKGWYDWSKKSAPDLKAKRDRFVLETVRNWFVKPEATSSSKPD